MAKNQQELNKVEHDRLIKASNLINVQSVDTIKQNQQRYKQELDQ